MPEDELHPQGCWLSLEKEAAALAGQTKLVRRVQLLFERITAFPRKIALERSRWLEVCKEVKLNEIIRKVCDQAQDSLKSTAKALTSQRVSPLSLTGNHPLLCSIFSGASCCCAATSWFAWQHATAPVQLVPSNAATAATPAQHLPQGRSLRLDVPQCEHYFCYCRLPRRS